MRIAIDARWIFEEMSGIGVYTRELIRHLARLDRHNSYIVIFNNPAVRDRIVVETGLSAAANFMVEMFPAGLFSVHNQVLLPGWLKKKRVDVFHSTNYMIPLAAFHRHRRNKIKCVVNIHDVIPMIFPHHAPKSKKSRLYPLYRKVMLEIGARSDVILTGSLSSRGDVIKHLRIPAGRERKVHAIYNGVSEWFHPALPALPPKRADDPRTVLYVGRFDPYKNVATLIRAFAEARNSLKFPAVLLLAGSADPRYPEALRLAQDLGVATAVKQSGYLSDGDLVRVYQSSDVLVHPSRYEGFGLQIAEAMACGLPVICSNAGSLTEVAGDAAILLDPDDVAGFAGRIVEVLTNPKLAAELSRKGRRQAERFSWERTARETLALYEEAGNAKVS